MSKLLHPRISFCFVLMFFLQLQTSIGQKVNPKYLDGEVYVKIKSTSAKFVQNATSSAVNVASELPFLSKIVTNNVNIEAIRPFYYNRTSSLQNVYRIKIGDPTQLNSYMQEIAKSSDVEYCEKVSYNQIIYTPNDPLNSSQWHLNTIKAYEAWDLSRGGVDIVVAVVDNAIQTNHIDLADNMVQGRDIADNDDNTNPINTNFSHGTHVAGIVGAVTNNSKGIASLGVNHIKIMPVKVTGDNQFYNGIYYGYEGIAWAAANGAKVINMSWGGGGYSLTEQQVINEAAARGCILVAAAGNDSVESLHYPSAYDNVIAVASTTSTEELSYFSNYGSWVDISAPGSSIYSTIPFDTYEYYSGTSMASPLTASLVAYIWSNNPLLTPAQVEARLKSSADNIDAQNPSKIGKLGAGRINAKRAIECPEGNFTVSISPTGNQIICSGQSLQLAASATTTGVNYQWQKNDVNIPGATQATYNPTSKGNYSVLGTKGTCSFAANYTVIDVFPSTISITSSNGISFCNGDSTVLSVPNIVGVTYQWKKNGQNIGINASRLVAKETGSYTLTATSSCGSITSAALSINVSSFTVTLAAISPQTTICSGDSVILNVTSSTTGVSYQWFKGASSIVNSSARYVTRTSGSYKVIGTKGNCSVSSNNIYVDVVAYSTPAPRVTSRRICFGQTIAPGQGLIAEGDSAVGDLLRTFTYNGPTIGYDDNAKSGNDPSVNVTDGTVISKITISVTWEKKDQGNQNTCGLSHGGGTPFNSEAQFKLRSPNGTVITLVPSGRYGGGYAGVITTVFDDDSSAIRNGDQPRSGSFKPEQLLSTFNGQNAQGTWTLLPADIVGADPLCVSGFSITIKTGIRQLPTITWFADSTTTTVLAQGREYIPTVSASGVYKYYVTATVMGACSSPRIPVSFTIGTSNIPAPTLVAFPVSLTQATSIENEQKKDIRVGLIIKEGKYFISNNTTEIYISDRPPLVNPITVCPGESILLLATNCASGLVTWSDGLAGAGRIVTAQQALSFTAICRESADGCSSTVSSVQNILMNNTNVSLTTALPNNQKQTFRGNNVVSNKGISTVNTDIQFTGSQYIELRDGFSSVQDFKAQIGGCPTANVQNSDK
ncbi:S8 family serine peptidase [Flectobacillus major]|uniref:S8 family serine peptidase n=1 Tax=Flectobacillus major TaxID=103 RepID=UPI0009DBD9B5|nr:S8 family serine peptidase [Flectobacillus major]